MSKDELSAYYDAGGIETLDIIKAKLTREQYRGYLLGNALKYLCRANFKALDGMARDLAKAANYAAWLRDEVSLENKTIDDFAAEQGVSPLTDASDLYGTWPGDAKDGLEDDVYEARHSNRAMTTTGWREIFTRLKQEIIGTK